jgi:transcriptional regulator with XRE-family HTH domain
MDGSNLPKWKNGESIPKADLIYAVAEYFEVSADYLLGRETPAKLSAVDNFSSDEYQIVMSLRMASRRTRGIALASMNAIIQAAGEQGEQIAAEKRSHADGSDDDQL